LVNITLNCQLVGFDIGCHEAIIMTNSMCTTVVEVTKNIHDTVYNALMMANVKANHTTV